MFKTVKTAISQAQALVARKPWRGAAQALAALAAVVGVAAASPAMAQSVVATPTKTTAAAPADAKQAVKVVLTQHKVVKGADGKEKLVDAATVKPGDVLEYRATYTNTSKGAVKALVATLPIPEGLVYIAHSAKPGAKLVQAATKDEVYAAEPLTRIVPAKTVNGKTTPEKVEKVPYDEYRSLHWKLDQLPAGGVTQVSARATVAVYVPPVAAEPSASSSAPQAPPAAAAKQ